jgi:hypothetical protein
MYGYTSSLTWEGQGPLRYPGSPLWHPLGTGYAMLALRLPGNPLTNAIHYGSWRRRLGISECKIVSSFGRGDRIGELRIGLGG